MAKKKKAKRKRSNKVIWKGKPKNLTVIGGSIRHVKQVQPAPVSYWKRFFIALAGAGILALAYYLASTHGLHRG